MQWLQLPPEVLESLALSNLESPEPHPIDPVLFFDLVKVRRLVEEASDLAVRAENGTTTSTLSNALNAGNGLAGSNGATALGLGLGYGGGPKSKLSRERRQRMRELACQKLSDAYHLDEVAASVATMQSASSLEEVAKLVLARNPTNVCARYVHFFHEKIPSRMLEECTTFKVLDDLIQQDPYDCAIWRTRAVTHLFKNNFHEALQDLTEALSVYRFVEAQHNTKGPANSLSLGDALAEKLNHNVKADVTKFEDGRFSSSREQQLLFYRAGVYLSLACQHISLALDAATTKNKANRSLSNSTVPNPPLPQQTVASDEAHQKQQEARKLVKTYAKRAAKDYMSFLSNFYYTAGVEIGKNVEDNCNQRVNDRLQHLEPSTTQFAEASPLEILSNSEKDMTDLQVIKRNGQASRFLGHSKKNIIYQLSSLFAPSPPVGLPAYPSTFTALALPTEPKNASPECSHRSSQDCQAVTYHPLLPEALHSLLLVHCLLQTSPKEHLRHAYMVARLVRISDGYPVFLSASCPARADWMEIIRGASNWIGLRQSWEILCSSVPSNDQVKKRSTTAKAGEKAHEWRRQEAIMEALADDRVHDEDSFQAAVAAREKRAEEQWENKGDGADAVQKWAVSNADEYPIGTERAEAIARWVRESPQTLVRAKRSGKSGQMNNVERKGSDEEVKHTENKE